MSLIVTDLAVLEPTDQGPLLRECAPGVSIGENARRLRGQICEGLGFLGVRLNAARNATNSAEISPPGAPVRVLVRRTGEEAMIARHTRAVLAQAGATG